MLQEHRRAALDRVRKPASYIRLVSRYPREARLFFKYRSCTMGSAQTIMQTLHLCRGVRQVHGDLVECGVWRGGMSAAMAEVLQGRASVLFDSFEGLPDAQPIDGAAAIAYQANVTSPGYHDNCRASEKEARRTMNMAETEYRIFSGWFRETVPKYAAEDPNIALLRLDGDLYDSVATCLEELFRHVVRGGLVIVDDYGWWDGCTRALHDFLSRTQATEAMRNTRSGVAYLLKG
jgi:O-methyltransferase